MPLDSKFTEEQLFDNLISSLVHSVWISLGKIKNPMTDKIERNLFAASMNIDMLDMLYKRMDGNLSEQEETYLSHVMSEIWLYALASALLVSGISLIAVFTLALNSQSVKRGLMFLVSMSTGALLGGAFLHLLPEAVEEFGFTVEI